jgi:hypothetical protein
MGNRILYYYWLKEDKIKQLQLRQQYDFLYASSLDIRTASPQTS